MLQEALELRIQSLVGQDAVEVVALGHPLDVQNDERNSQGMLGQNSLRNCLGRPDDTAIAAERVEEIVTEPFEQIDVLGFLTRKVQKCADARVVSMKDRPGVIQNERQDELLHEAEDVEVVMPTDLVQRQAILRV